MVVYSNLQCLKLCMLHSKVVCYKPQNLLFAVRMHKLGYDRLLLFMDCTTLGHYMFIVLRIMLGSIGCEVSRNTPCLLTNTTV